MFLALIGQALDEVRAREVSIVDLQKKVIEGENKLKQQQTQYEAVRSERNLYSKTLLEVQDEIQELKRKFKIMTHHIENLKEEINAKDLALIKEHYDHTKVQNLLDVGSPFTHSHQRFLT